MNESKKTETQLFTTRQVLKLVPGLDRDLLYFWAKRKGWLGEPNTDENVTEKDTVRKRRKYTREELDKIRLLYRSHDAGYKPAVAGGIARSSGLLADPKLYERVIKAMTEITSSVPLHDLRKTLDTAVEQLHQVIEVEQISIFLIERDKDEPQLGSYDRPGTSDRAEPTYAARLCAQQRKIVRIDPPEFADSSSVAGKAGDSGRAGYYSLLAVPMLARAKGLIGVLEFTNRKSKDRQKQTAFDSPDETVCNLLADQLTQCVQAIRIFETQKQVIDRLERGDTHRNILDWLLSRVLLILPAERADIAIKESDSDKVIVYAKRGPGFIEINKELPPESLGYLMCNQHLSSPIVQQVSAELKDYVPLWKDARSVISVAFDFPFPQPGRLGALTAESSRYEAFEVGYHGDILERLTTSIALGDAFVRHGFDTRLDLAKQLIPDVLATIKQGLGMDAAIVYKLEPFQWSKFARSDPDSSPDQDTPPIELHCVAAAGCPQTIDNHQDFRYLFDKPSFARKIFESGLPQYSGDPRNDPEVCATGLEYFDIQGPLVGAPMIHGNVVVGALVCWSRFSNPPVESDKERLLPYAKLLASSLFLSESAAKYRTERLRQVKDVLLHIQTEQTKDRAIEIILKALQTAGFDRARAFQYVQGSHEFEPLLSVGMKDPEKFLRGSIKIEKSFYAIQTFKEGTRVASRIFPIAEQPDPYEEQLDKLPGWPWAQVSLVIHGRQYGYLAADNHVERRPITQDMLDFLTIMGGLAAQAIQNHPSVPV